jgi:hypothetical protein
MRHKIQVNCNEKWIQFFRSSENETSWDLVPHEKGTMNIWGHMYKAFIFWYSMLTWDHWEFQLWKATEHDSQELDFVQGVKGKRPSCMTSSAKDGGLRKKIRVNFPPVLPDLGIFRPCMNVISRRLLCYGPAVELHSDNPTTSVRNSSVSDANTTPEGF